MTGSGKKAECCDPHQITAPAESVNLSISTFLNGTKVDQIQLDTSTTSTSTIDYVATDQWGQTAKATRKVIVDT